MLHSILKCVLIDFFIQWLMFCYSAISQTEKYFDLTGSLTFICLTSLSYLLRGRMSTRQIIQSTFILVWAVRLGSFLFVRIKHAGGRDPRFDKYRNDPIAFFLVWNMQGIWVLLNMLPTLLLNFQTRGIDKPFTTRDYVGWSLWIVGFLVEVIADYQKSSFRSVAANSEKFISTGLWKYSRHPNYLGEILLWFGLYIAASSCMSGYQYLSVICPILNMWLITRFSGIPPLEKRALHRWGRNPAYLNYIQNTAVLIPGVW